MHVLSVTVVLLCCASWASAVMKVWLTTGSKEYLLSPRPTLRPAGNAGQGHVINVDRSKRYQTMEGFGAALTSSAAYNIYHSREYEQIIQELFGSNGIGMSYIRLPMGASDMQAETPYTYADNQYDFNMDHFSINRDRTFIIPVLKKILSVVPNLKIVATPWTPPAWMKTSNNLFGGELKSGDNYQEALAKYFVKFIQAYQAEGIRIDAITIQNEPLLSTHEYPSMLMPWQTQANIIKNHLGPAFRNNGINTKILLYDHNWDVADYPKDILRDSNARQYVSGVAWHCYAGNHYTPNDVHNEFTDIGMYFTECSGGDWSPEFSGNLVWNSRLISIGQPRNWGKTVLFFNLALDENHGPTVGVNGCKNCRGVLTVPSNGGNHKKEVEYYVIGHLSKFVQPNAVRVDTPSFGWDELHNVAFQNPDGSLAILVLNPSDSSIDFSVHVDGQYYNYYGLQGHSIATLSI